MNARLFSALSLLVAALGTPACSSTDAKPLDQGGAAIDGVAARVSARFFMPTEQPTNTAAPTIEVDRTGAIHAVYPQYVGQGAFYAYCPASCSAAGHVKVVRLETNGTVHNAMLALDGAGHPHVLLASAVAVYYATPEAGASVVDAAAWSKVEVLRHDGAREVTGEAFALDRSGHPRFVMHTTKAYLGVGQKAPEALWVACDAASCATPSAWKRSKIADQMWRGSSLRYDARGVAKLATAATIDVTPTSSGVTKAAYLECESDCGREESWRGIALLPTFESTVEAVPVPPAIALALTRAGAPRVAFLGVTEFGKKNITYFACDDGCTGDGCTGDGWRGTVLSEHTELGAGIDLALDAGDRPRLVHTASASIGIGACDASDCARDDARWVFSPVEESRTMKADEISLYDNCTVSAWFLHSPSIALTTDGRPRVGYQARDISAGLKNSDPTRKRSCVAGTDMTWSRLALMQSPGQ